MRVTAAIASALVLSTLLGRPAAAEVRTSPVVTSSAAASAAGGEGSLFVRAALRSTLLDYGLPGHATLRGESALGTVLRAALAWRIAPRLEVEAGALARVPFALELEPDAGVLPVLSVSVRPLGDERLVLRFGSLDAAHGYHPAVVDEARYAYGRGYAAAYVRSLASGVTRAVGTDPFMPAEHGAQAVLQLGGWLRAEGFLDWQLIETAEHREKFAVGLLASVRHALAELSLQLRLGHYGGETYTRTDPVRAAGLDPVRQPLTLAAAGLLRPWTSEVLTVELPVAWIRGRLAQAGGEAPSVHHGLEAGVEVVLFDRARLGWRHWAPLERAYGFLSEDGEPVYAGRRSERVRLVLSECFGPAEVSGRLDVVLADQAKQVEYLTVTTVSFAWERLLFGDDAAPASGANPCVRRP